MDTTYKRCSQGVVWLGYASEEHKSVVGVKAINVIGGQSDGLSLREFGAARPPLPTAIDGHPPQIYLPAIRRLLERPWFTRVWTVQEYCLAPRVTFMCGLDTFPSPRFTNLQLGLLSIENIESVPQAHGVSGSIQPWLLDTIDAVLGLNWTGGIQLALQLVTSKTGLNSPREKREAFWRTIIANRRHDSSSVDSAANAESSGFDLWWQGVTELVNPQQVAHGGNEFERWWRAVYTLTIAADKIKAASEYNRAFFLNGAGRVLFTTASGFLGLSRTTINVGDQVCLLAGGQTPFVLRSLHDKHQLVSEAYVHGIMDGKYWADLEESKTERLTFVLV
ncbi:hypothetical protein LTR12_009433 [Friedmanniomyces endolithicus]|nr:hypothetical protein LTR74_016760 [Friedmanniomyces endolithicus]KAK1816184.1 hypothetical protein LTR12_009433 [Friedmanniomyces endolithicus]